MSTRVTVVLTGWKVGLQTINLMKLLRRYGHINLRDAKRLVEELVRDRMIGVEVDPNDVAEFVSRARAAGAIIERPD